MGGFVLVSVALAFWSHLVDVERRHTLNKARVVKARLDVSSVMYSMALMKTKDDLSMEALQSFEDCRDQGSLVFCDTTKQTRS